MQGAERVDPQLIERLIEEQIWTNNSQDMQSHFHLDGSASSGNSTYLEGEVFPTLVPAIHALLEQLAKKMEEDGANSSNLTRKYGATEAQKEVPDFGCTGRTHPTDWIAQYLVRNNTRHSGALTSHPYNQVLSEAKRKSQGTR